MSGCSHSLTLSSSSWTKGLDVESIIAQVTDDDIEDGRAHTLEDKSIPDCATIFRIVGPFLFGATDKLSSAITQIDSLPPVVIIRLRDMTAIDATGLFAIEEVAIRLHATGRTLILCGARKQPAPVMHKTEFEEVACNNICVNIQEALERAKNIHTKVKLAP